MRYDCKRQFVIQYFASHKQGFAKLNNNRVTPPRRICCLESLVSQRTIVTCKWHTRAPKDRRRRRARALSFSLSLLRVGNIISVDRKKFNICCSLCMTFLQKGANCLASRSNTPASCANRLDVTDLFTDNRRIVKVSHFSLPKCKMSETLCSFAKVERDNFLRIIWLR